MDTARKIARSPKRGTVALLLVDEHTSTALTTHLKTGYHFEAFESHEPLISALGLGSLRVDVLVIGPDVPSPLDVALTVRKSLRSLQVIVLAELRDVDALRRQLEMKSDDSDEMTIWPSQHLKELPDRVRKSLKRAHRRVRKREESDSDHQIISSEHSDAGDHLTQLLERAPIGILTISRSGEVRTLNAQARELLCAAGGSAINRPIYDFFPVFEQRKLRALLRTDDVDSVRLEDRRFRVAGDDDKRRYAEITVTGDVLQLEETCTMLTLNDVTSIVTANLEAQRMAAALKASEERFDEFAEAMNMVSWEADPESLRLTSIGDRVEDVMGYPPSRWLSKSFWVDRLHPDDRDHTLDRVNRDCQRLQNFDHDFRMYDAHGNVRWLRNIVNVVRDESGQLQRVRGFIVDLTKNRASG